MASTLSGWVACFFLLSQAAQLMVCNERFSQWQALTVSCLLAGSTQQHWPFPENRIALGYAYLFTHPGNPTIFWDHYFNSHCRDTIDQLISLRKRNGLNAKSSIEILAAEHDFYLARIDNK